MKKKLIPSALQTHVFPHASTHVPIIKNSFAVLMLPSIYFKFPFTRPSSLMIP
jgi:hypothetical protein